MKLAILLLCHKNAEQINMFLDIMEHPDIEFFIHMDKKADIVNQIEMRQDIHILPDHLRVDVKWSGFSMIEATLNLIRLAYKEKRFDYYWLCSGQDFPIKSAEYILDYFQKNKGNNFISYWPSYQYGTERKETHKDKRNILKFPHFMMGRSILKRVIKRAYIEVSGGWTHTYNVFRRKDKFSTVPFYFGPQWIAITNNFVSWLLDYLKRNPWYAEGYRHSLTPDESFFQTLFMMSPYKENRYDYLHYVDWSSRDGRPVNSPNVLTVNDFDNLVKSKFLMARKFDLNVDKEIIEKLAKVCSSSR
ncbi:beta-1,6-N-acetylglucosaminyltransferase [Mitsuokella sp. WILCCON 0060]|uniref:beta-1,6-N-acetylglucosaminyltransferase n=1 Tax=Mitsuokella sp. WILCCON 0060 TaxID=3345341 RepID=UPI003F1BCCE5